MKNLKGRVFGCWVVLEETFDEMVLCECSCGVTKKVNRYNLIAGKSKKCAELGKHKAPATRENHRLYSIWKSMRSRCNNPSVNHYKNYGGRGIKVCKKWEDFDEFANDMYPSFIEGLTLDRIDNNGDYCKENCRWSTIAEQNNNQRKCLKLLFNGIVYTESELSKATGVKRTTLQSRRNKGFTVEEMIYGRPRKIQKTKQGRAA